MKNKLGISPVVATALLLVVAVTAVVGFGNWFTGFQSNIEADANSQSSDMDNFAIDTIVSDRIYWWRFNLGALN